MPRKKKITNAALQIDGNLDSPQFTSLDDILGERLHPYPQKTSKEYDQYLSELNMTDLQSHARRVGLLPVNDRRVLVERLQKQYARANRGHVSFQQVQQKVQNLEDVSPAIQRILREGA